ncbi:hypothetical protein RF11_04928 [Thelohanellus kitauei]|uniref:Uncharacterized protein n=1 Tax=Thelohanellus kitauei TaxID=669202 RepID=A0A0C2IYG5_THEKT|nr:hypothetical protein RF11_04928 [Thelohanellus kitauei]
MKLKYCTYKKKYYGQRGERYINNHKPSACLCEISKSSQAIRQFERLQSANGELDIILKYKAIGLGTYPNFGLLSSRFLEISAAPSRILSTVVTKAAKSWPRIRSSISCVANIDFGIEAPPSLPVKLSLDLNGRHESYHVQAHQALPSDNPHAGLLQCIHSTKILFQEFSAVTTWNNHILAMLRESSRVLVTFYGCHVPLHLREIKLFLDLCEFSEQGLVTLIVAPTMVKGNILATHRAVREGTDVL